MKKYLVSLISFFMAFNPSFADSLYINPGDTFGNIVVTSPSFNIYNYGTINGFIDANDNNIFLYNTGTISGNIITDHGEIVTQIIRSDADRTNFMVNPSNFRVEIDTDSTNINFDNLKTINASEIIISNSRIEINDFTDWQNWDKNVDLQGPVYLIVKGAVHNGDIITHAVSGDTVIVEVQGLSGLYRADVVWNGGNWIITNVRETNYDKVEIETFEALRSNRSNDKLLSALDTANSWEEIEHIKNLSYQFNHKIMLRPVKAINNFSLLDMIKDETDAGAGVSTSYMLSDSINGFGGRIYTGQKYENLYFNVGFSFNSFSYKDSLNDFSGLMYGLDIKSKQLIDKIWLRETFGANLTKFKANYVTDTNEIKNNPVGYSLFGAVDTGYDFNVFEGFVVVPIVGIVWQNAKVADVADTEFYVRGGGEGKYAFITDGIKYEYSLESFVGTNGNFSTGIKIGFWSVEDEGGVDLGINAFKDEFDWRYKFSLTGKILF